MITTPKTVKKPITSNGDLFNSKLIYWKSRDINILLDEIIKLPFKVVSSAIFNGDLFSIQREQISDQKQLRVPKKDDGDEPWVLGYDD